jgi:hypothetical protein
MVSRIINFNTDQVAPFEAKNRLLLMGMAGQSCRLILWNRETAAPEAVECFQLKNWTQENWDMLLNQSALLGFRDVEARVSIGFDRGTPVPAAIYGPEVATASLEALFGLAGDQLYSGADIANGSEIIFTWQMSAALHSLVANQFSVCSFRHEATSIINPSPWQGSCIQCMVYDEYAWVTLHHNGALRIARPVAARFANDFTYQLLNMCKVNELDPTVVELQLIGFVEPGSHITQAVERFFPVKTYPQPTGEWPADVPYHYFVQMLRLIQL